MPLGFSRFALRIRRGNAARTLSAWVSSLHLLFLHGFRLAVHQQDPLACLGPSLRRGLARGRAFFRSRITVPSGSSTRMSTSQPPFTYGLTVTLIAVHSSAMAPTSGRASVTGRLRAAGHAGRCERSRAVVAARSSRRSRACSCATAPRPRQPSAAIRRRACRQFSTRNKGSHLAPTDHRGRLPPKRVRRG